jgi:hypothetical protein
MNIIKLIEQEYKKFLNEDVGSSKYFSNIGFKTEDVFDLIQHHDSFRDLYPEYDEDNEYEDDYYFPTKEIAYEKVNEILDFFNSLENPIPIYRSIRVKSVDDINYDYLGDSWSFDKQSAVNFAKNQAGGNFLLTAKTKFDNVDWKMTIELFFIFSDNYDSYDENEIKIIDSDEVFDIEVTKI